MSPPSPMSSAPAGWNGRKDTMMTVNSSAAIAVATPSRVNAALSGARSVLFRLAVLLIGISEFGQHAAQRHMDRVDGGRRRSCPCKPGGAAKWRGGKQVQALQQHLDAGQRGAG